MIGLPDYLSEDESFIYCPKENINDIYSYEYFIPLDDLLEDSIVTSAFFNIIGTLYGKLVIII